MKKLINPSAKIFLIKAYLRSATNLPLGRINKASSLRIATDSGKTARRIYRESAAKQRGIGRTLLSRELGRFTSRPAYMLNCGLGVVLLPICAAVLLIKGGEVISVMNMIFGAREGFVQILLCAGLCTAASMNDMTEPSISHEGRNL